MTETVYLYQLIEFIDEKIEDGKKCIECIPTKWVEFDIAIGQCYAQFMSPPYTTESKKQLEKMIVDNVDPPYDWPRYAVIIRGGAATYKEAVQRLQRLTVEEYAYTTGCDEPQKKAQIITKSFANRARENEEKIRNIMDVPTLQNSSTPHQSSAEYSASSENDSGSTVQDENSPQYVGRQSKCKTSKKSAFVPKVKRQLKYLNRCETLDGKYMKVDTKERSSEKMVLPLALRSSNKSSLGFSPRFITKDSVPHELEFKDIHTESYDRTEPFENILHVSKALNPVALMKKINASKNDIHTTKSPKRIMPVKTSEVHKLYVADSPTEYDMKLLITELRSLRYEQREAIIKINKLQETLENALATGAVQVQHMHESFEMKYKLQFPFTTYEQFVEFDTKLSEDKECQKAFVQALSRKFDDKKSITKNITAVLKRYFSRNVALLFNAQKKVEGKFLFKDTTFSNCLQGEII